MAMTLKKQKTRNNKILSRLLRLREEAKEHATVTVRGQQSSSALPSVPDKPRTLGKTLSPPGRTVKCRAVLQLSPAPIFSDPYGCVAG